MLERRPTVRGSTTTRRVVAGCAGLGVASLFVVLSAVPARAVTCSGGATMTIDLASGESVTLSLSGDADPRTIVVTPSDPSCGGFDTSTVTTIGVNGVDGNEGVTIDQSASAPFPHENTASIVLALGGGSDALEIVGQVTADTIGLGADGISLDAGSTPDVTGIGSAEKLTITAGGGDDVVSGKLGDALGGDLKAAATILGAVGNDALTGGTGNDLISGGEGTDTLKGGKGADALSGGGGADVLSGGAGDDALSGGADADRVKGGDQGDSLDGGGGRDSMNGGQGPDAVDAGGGNDTLFGNGGDDHLRGEAGRDQLLGGKGNDHCLGGPDPDSITGCEHGHP